MFLVPIALIVVVSDPVQFIVWVVPSYENVDIVLDSTIVKLQCSIFCMKTDMNRVFPYAMAYIISLK